MENKVFSETSPFTEANNPKNELQELLENLPKERIWNDRYLYFYKGFWCPRMAITGMINFQKHFQAHDTDIVLASIPKTGTTWLKALTFSIINRTKYPLAKSPLLTANPHSLIPFFELDLYKQSENPNLQGLPCPRIFATHAPYQALPCSVVNSKCRFIYVCRNPLDQFISHWHFFLSNLPDSHGENVLPLDESFKLFCRGIHSFGPFWEHVLGYWNSSLKDPEKVLFLRYEDLKKNITTHVKKMAEFMGFPFSEEEEEQGLVEEIVRLCSFENLKELEVNKKGRVPSGLKNSSFFRKGEVGDWANHLSAPMAESYKKLVEEKLGSCGLSFQGS